MPYATIRDVKTLVSPTILVALTDDDKNGQPDDYVIEAALERAEGLIDAALAAAGYAVPVAMPIPAGAGLLVGANTWLAVCDLAARRGVVPEDYRTQCDLYKGILSEIKSGTMVLPLPAGSINMPHSSTQGQQRRLSVSKLEEGTLELRNPDERHTLDTI